jgi:hypothetical protein
MHAVMTEQRGIYKASCVLPGVCFQLWVVSSSEQAVFVCR